MTPKTWLREPLLHFLVVGGLLFLAAGWIWPAPEAGRVISIGRAELLDHLQSRAQLYDEEGFATLLDGMSADERAQLLRDAAVSEALYREGEALGLSDADPVVKARVIQQMRLLLMEEAAADVTLTEEDVRAFYQANSARYAEGARASFTHVFLSSERRGEVAAGADAQALLGQLQQANVSAAEAGQYGDRFLYQRNYSEAGVREIAGQFGEDFAAALFASEASDEWQGPLQSQYGWHLLALRTLTPARTMPFDEIAARVAEDALAEERSRRAISAIGALMESYDVRDEEGITQ